MRVTARNMVAHQNRKEKRASGACARCTRPNCDLALEASLRAKELSERPERSEGRERITRRGVPLSDNWLVQPIYIPINMFILAWGGGPFFSLIVPKLSGNLLPTNRKNSFSGFSLKVPPFCYFWIFVFSPY